MSTHATFIGLWLSCLILSGSLQAQELHVDNRSAIYNLMETAKWFADTSGKLTYQDLADTDSFHLATDNGPILNYGLTKAAIWCQLSIANTTQLPLQLAIANSNIDSIQLYYQYQNQWQALSAGHKIDHWDAIEQKPFYVFNLPAFDQQTRIWIRFKSNNTLVIPLFVGTGGAMEKKMNSHLLEEGLFAGIFIALFIYNLLFWLTTRLRIYLYYILFVGFSAAYILLYIRGLAHLFNRSIINWIASYAFSISNLGYFFAISFSRSFLNKSMDRWMVQTSKFLQAAIAVNIAANLLGYYQIALKGTQLISFAFLLLVIVMAANSYKNGYKLAKFFLIGWGLFLGTLLIFTLAIIKLLPFSLFIMQLPQFGLSLELFWLSFFLGHSFNVLKKEKIELQKQSLYIVTAKKEELEITVAERTMDLLNSNQIKDKILASISHDLRMPLVNTLGILELMESGLIKPNQSKLKITQVKLSIGEIANTMHNLIKWSAMQLVQNKPNPELVDLSDMLAETLNLYTLSIIQKSIQVTINCNSARVLIDREQLKIILRNLIDNAIKYNTPEGKVLIDCYQRPDQPTLVLVSVSNSHPYSPENLAPIFEQGKLVQPATGNGQQHSGLGLHLCRDFLAINGSELTVEIKNALWISSFELPVPIAANR